MAFDHARKLVVIGAGMASGRALEHLFEADPDAYEVTLFNAEPRGNYNRSCSRRCSRARRPTTRSSPTTTPGTPPTASPPASASR